MITIAVPIRCLAACLLAVGSSSAFARGGPGDAFAAILNACLVVAMNMGTLGLVERMDNRKYLELTGQISRSAAKKGNILDMVLSILGFVCLGAFSRSVSRKIVNSGRSADSKR